MSNHRQSLASPAILKRAGTMALNELSLWLRGRPAYHREFAAKERMLRRSGPPVRPRDRRWWNRRGFLSDKAGYYSPEHVSLYISDLQRMILCSRISYPNHSAVFNKRVFGRLMDRIGFGIPVHAVIKRGTLIGEGADSPISGVDSLLGCLQAGQRLVLKPIDGMEGRDVIRLAKSDRPDFVACGNTEISDADFPEWIAQLDGLLIQPELSSSGYSSEIWPHSLNTMRVITMTSPSSGEPFIAAVSHKFGTKRSRVVDNWKQGGVLAAVDVPTGELGSAFLYPESGVLHPIESHPETGGRIRGRVIPNWDAFTEYMLRLAREFDYMPLLGWDVAWTGVHPVVVEANFNPDWSIVQCFKPLLADDRVRAFFEHHRVIERRRVN